MEPPQENIFFYIDRKLNELLEVQKESLEILNAQQRLARYGLDGFREMALKENGKRDAAGFREHLSDIILNDKELRHPHIKILNYLADQYDMQTGFQEIHFSKIVEEARIGKNKAKGYLDLLVNKSLVETRNDGYRVFYRIIPP